jgi:hypothetical protein
MNNSSNKFDDKSTTSRKDNNSNVDPSNQDITEVLGMGEELKNLENEVFQNMSEAQKNYFNKLDIMVKYRNQLFLNNFQNTLEKGYLELVVI